MPRRPLHHLRGHRRGGHGAAAAARLARRGRHRPGHLRGGQRRAGVRRGRRHDPGARQRGDRRGAACRGGGDLMSTPPTDGPTDGDAAMEALYPFLYADSSDLSAVLEQVRASTAAKAEEILQLRRIICERDGARLAECAQRAAGRFLAGGRLFAFGNGGSATDAQQLATLFLDPGGGVPALPAFGLASDTAVVTALCNDIGVDVVFSRQLAAFGGRDDIAVGLSTSGNSPNLLRAFDEASRRGMLTIGLAGYDGGKMAELDSIDYLFVAPTTSIHRIQEAQTTIYQVFWELTVAALASATASPLGNPEKRVSDVPRHTR